MSLQLANHNHIQAGIKKACRDEDAFGEQSYDNCVKPIFSGNA
jgi:hypothetical protein